MPAGSRDTGGEVGARVTQRWQAIDPLLPEPAEPSAGCGASLAAGRPGGPPAAVGICDHWSGEPGSLDLSWGAAHRFRLAVQVPGPDIADPLDELLSQWRDHLAGEPGTEGADTAAIITWPSRDIAGVAALLRHGLAPSAVIAARVAACPSASPAGAPERPELRIRRAGPDDAGAVARLGLEVVRYDAHFGGVVERPDTVQALEREAAVLLAGPEPWIWLAERDGRPVGLLCAERPESAAWIAPLVRVAPVAYLMLMVVLPGERGGGVGAEMVARFHREADAAGVAVTLLHYAQTNPLSAPFWSQQGYRPLWTSWEARPARTLR